MPLGKPFSPSNPRRLLGLAACVAVCGLLYPVVVAVRQQQDQSAPPSPLRRGAELAQARRDVTSIWEMRDKWELMLHQQYHAYRQEFGLTLIDPLQATRQALAESQSSLKEARKEQLVANARLKKLASQGNALEKQEQWLLHQETRNAMFKTTKATRSYAGHLEKALIPLSLVKEQFQPELDAARLLKQDAHTISQLQIEAMKQQDKVAASIMKSPPAKPHLNVFSSMQTKPHLTSEQALANLAVERASQHLEIIAWRQTAFSKQIAKKSSIDPGSWQRAPYLTQLPPLSYRQTDIDRQSLSHLHTTAKELEVQINWFIQQSFAYKQAAINKRPVELHGDYDAAGSGASSDVEQLTGEYSPAQLRQFYMQQIQEVKQMASHTQENLKWEQNYLGHRPTTQTPISVIRQEEPHASR
jgi:hypothetical protein